MQILIDTGAKTLTIKGTVSLDELFSFLTDKVQDWPDWNIQSEENKYGFDHWWKPGIRSTSNPYDVTVQPYTTTTEGRITTTSDPIWTTEGHNITYTTK